MSDRFGTTVRRLAMACMVAGLGLAGTASATLLDRGPDLVYDDALSITWTRNASLPGSSGLTWDEAKAWAASLVLSGFDDWRLPYANVTAGSGPTHITVSCPTAPEVACRDNEMAYMFYHNLEGQWGYPKTGTQTAIGGQQLIGIQASYWTGTEYPPLPYGASAFGFDFSTGIENTTERAVAYAAWAVRSGDVTAIPEPSGLLLVGAGMLGLAWARSSRPRR